MLKEMVAPVEGVGALVTITVGARILGVFRVTFDVTLQRITTRESLAAVAYAAWQRKDVSEREKKNLQAAMHVSTSMQSSIRSGTRY